MDGVLVGSGAVLNSTRTGALWIGGAASVTEYFRGLIDDVRIYNRALTDVEIGALASAPLAAQPAAPVFLAEPADTFAAVGDKARFTARVNALEVSYQWYKSNSALGTESPATFSGGASTALLTTDALTAADNGAGYSVVFKGTFGSITSRVARVTLALPVFSPGFLKREVYTGITGSTLGNLAADAKFPDADRGLDQFV